LLTLQQGPSTILLQQRWPGTPAFAIGEQPLLETLEQAGCYLTGTTADVVVLDFDSGLNYAKLHTAIRAALVGATIVAANPDLLTPVHDGLTAVPTVVGRPHPFTIEQALKHLGTSKEETVMIGDQLATTIVAGRSAGLRAILIAGNVPFNAVAGVAPGRIISSLLDLVGATSEETGVA
jgi:4-nitrophenyl phosphatase